MAHWLRAARTRAMKRGLRTCTGGWETTARDDMNKSTTYYLSYGIIGPESNNLNGELPQWDAGK